jgi:exopolysaccharide biosynthesis polyprenyl glycosylphosphotransferase
MRAHRLAGVGVGKGRSVAIIGRGDSALKALHAREDLAASLVYGGRGLSLVTADDLREVADEVVLAFAPEDAKHAVSATRCLVDDGLPFRVTPETLGCVYPLLDGLGWLGVPVLPLRTGVRDLLARSCKRVTDVVVAALTLVALLPLLLLVAALIHLESPGPVIFRQRRVGLNGRPFRILKFRTMVDDAQEREAELRSSCSADPRFVKIVGDPRITRLGRILRKTSIDELPQLWNVLRGEMSLVGPRPSQPSEVAHYRPHQFSRLLVKPGVTGMWQVSGRSNLCFDDAVTLDAAYVRDWSPWLDLKIMVRTVGVVLRCTGAC